MRCLQKQWAPAVFAHRVQARDRIDRIETTDSVCIVQLFINQHYRIAADNARWIAGMPEPHTNLAPEHMPSPSFLQPL